MFYHFEFVSERFLLFVKNNQHYKGWSAIYTQSWVITQIGVSFLLVNAIIKQFNNLPNFISFSFRPISPMWQQALFRTKFKYASCSCCCYLVVVCPISTSTDTRWKPQQLATLWTGCCWNFSYVVTAVSCKQRAIRKKAGGEAEYGLKAESPNTWLWADCWTLRGDWCNRRTTRASSILLASRHSEFTKKKQYREKRTMCARSHNHQQASIELYWCVCLLQKQGATRAQTSAVFGKPIERNQGWMTLEE